MDNIMALIKEAQEGNRASRNRIVEENVGLVWSIVKRFNGRGYEAEDLFQIGCIGLIKAIEKFDFSFDVKFSTYAVPMILGEIKRFIRDDGMIKVSRSLKETAGKLYQAREQLTRKYGREPTLDELIKLLEITQEEALLALESNAEVESLYLTIHQNDGNPIYLIDKLNDSENEEDKMVTNLSLKNFINNLCEKEKTIIEMRYYADKTQAEVAKVIGISQVQVSRIEKKVLLRMRKLLEAN